jgi:hypothetical protein
MNAAAHALALQLFRELAFPEMFWSIASSPEALEALKVFVEETPIFDGHVMKEMTSDGPSGLKGEKELDNSRQFFQKHFPQVHSSTIENYLEANSRSVPVTSIYGELSGAVLLSEDDMQLIFRGQTGWDRFRKWFPKSSGIKMISSPGFSTDGSQALVQLGQQSDYLSGCGVCYFYELKNGVWRQVGKATTWVS